MTRSDLKGNIEKERIKSSLDLLKKHFCIEKVSNTQLKVFFNFENTIGLTDDIIENVYKKEFILDTTRVGFSTKMNIGGICDGGVLRINNFYSVYIFFDIFWNFSGIGLVQCNKSTIGGAVAKTNTQQIITISESANFWADDYADVTIYKNTSQWQIGRAKRYSATQLEIVDTGDYGGAIIDDVDNAYIYEICDKWKQQPYNINHNIISDNWLWLTSGIRIDGSGYIQGFIHIDNLYKIDSAAPQIDAYASSYTVFSLLEYISPATKFNELGCNIFSIQASSVGEIVTNVYYKNIKKAIEGYFLIRVLSPCQTGLKQSRKIEFDNGLLQTYTSTNGTGATGSRFRWIISYKE